MLNEALVAAEMLREQNFSLKVINLPWLNRIDEAWFEKSISDCNTVFVLDNHSYYGGLGDQILNTAQKADAARSKRFIKFGLDEYPACGTPVEVLSYHKLNGENLAKRIHAALI
jgi:transketolase